MILTVTINPLLEMRLTYPNVHIGSEHRNPVCNFSVGGKGINVSRQLKKLNLDSLAFTFIGGNNGKIISNLLSDEKINFTSIRIKNEIREATVVFDETKKSTTTFFGNNFYVSENEVNEFKSKLEKIIKNCDVIIFSGSSPCKETDSIFPFGIEIANQNDKVSLLDTYGNHLRECLISSPTIVHNNVDEIKNSLNIKLDSQYDKIDFLNFLYEKNIKQSFLTDGEKDTFAANFDFHYRIKNPKIDLVDATGCGDSFVTGIVYSFFQNSIFEDALIFASSLSAANASRNDVCKVSIEEINKLKSQIRIETIGKRMRL